MRSVKVGTLESIKQDLNLEEVGEAIDDEFAMVITNLLAKGMPAGRKAARPPEQNGAYQ